MVTEAIRSRMVWVITGVLALLVLLALPGQKAESADYETTLDRLGRLQALAEQYIEEKNSGDDPIDLTLSFTRVGDYNTTIWQLTAAPATANLKSTPPMQTRTCGICRG